MQDHVGEGRRAWGRPQRPVAGIRVACHRPSVSLRSCQALIDFVKTHHSYDCPEVILTDVVKGNPGYLSFVHDNTAPPEAAE